MQPNLNGTELGIHSDFGSFLFGDSAQNISAMTRRFQSYEDCLTDAYAANCLLAIAEMNGGNVVNCELTLSLPYQSMRNDRMATELKTKLASSHTIKKLSYHKQTINVTFPIKWPIMPQNVAPAFVSLAPSGRFKSDATGLIWIGVINVGSKTLELGTFGIDVDSYSLRASNQHMTFAKGVYTLADSVRPLLLDVLQGKRSSLTQHEIFNSLVTDTVQYGNENVDVFNSLVTDTVQYGNENVDVSTVVYAARSDYRDTVRNHCLENWTANRGKEPGEIYQYCVSGGGAHIVAPFLRDVGFHNNIVVSNDPQFDVVRGSLNWRKLVGG
jgi:hypothetical protein